jgi:polyisoprenoid-binding protein YceI
MTQKLTTAIIAIIAITTMAFTFPTEKTNEITEAPKPIPTNATTQTVSTSKSSVGWKGYKVTGEHAGTIQIKKGALQFNENQLVGGSFVIDMTTIKCTDLKGGGAKKLEGHLMSADFFGVEKYPTASFEITKVISRGKPGEYKIVGNLTIKETTKSIKFLAKVSDDKTATAKVKIDRSDFKVKYGSGSFFDALGDKTIYDEFDLDINLVIK